MESEPRPLRKRVARGLAGAASALALTEIGAALVHLLLAQQCFSYTEAEARRARILAAEVAPTAQANPTTPDFMRSEVVHPYVGYLRRPTPDGADAEAPYPYAAGLFDDMGPDAFRVAIVGGSVAEQVGGVLHDALVEAGAPAERLHVVALASGGVKQPQQLATLSYLLALGADIDLLINLDGFNEAVLPVHDNWANEVYPHYPRGWHQRFTDADDPALTRAIGRLTVRREDRADSARWLGGSPLRFSVFANVLWMAWDASSSRRVADARAALDEASRTARGSYQLYGPQPSMNREEVFADAARVWARSSIVMHHISRQRGITYVHMLQPNQYLEGTKPLSDEERERFVNPASSYAPLVPVGYAALREAEPAIRAAGVCYFDLTELFADDPETRYEDDCCHFDMPGRRIVAARVAELALAAHAEDAAERLE